MLKSSASTGKGVYGWSSVRVERTPVAGSQVGAGMYGEVAQKSVKLPSVCPGCLLFSIKHARLKMSLPSTLRSGKCALLDFTSCTYSV